MNPVTNPYVREELDNLERQFGAKAYLTLDEYAEFYGTNRRWASQHLRRKGIPFAKEGKSLYISMIDLAVYKAKCKAGPDGAITLMGIKEKDNSAEMKRRRGFSQMAEKRRLGT